MTAAEKTKRDALARFGQYLAVAKGDAQLALELMQRYRRGDVERHADLLRKVTKAATP